MILKDFICDKPAVWRGVEGNFCQFLLDALGGGGEGLGGLWGRLGVLLGPLGRGGSRGHDDPDELIL